MTPAEIYVDLYGRVPDLVHAAVDGLTPDQLMDAPPGATNHIGWLAWHIARVLDHQISGVRGVRQLWESPPWPSRFGDADPGADNLGYGHTPEQVAGVRPESAEVVLEYLDAVCERTKEYLGGLGPDDLDRVVDEGWDPPVTLGVRLISVADDALQHAGQAAYARGALGY